MKEIIIRDLKAVLIVLEICLVIKAFYDINYNYKYSAYSGHHTEYIIYTDRGEDSLYYKGISSMVVNQESDKKMKEIIASNDIEKYEDLAIIWNALTDYSEQEKEMILYYVWNGIERQDETGIQLMERLTFDEYSTIVHRFAVIVDSMCFEYANAFGSTGNFYLAFEFKYL